MGSIERDLLTHEAFDTYAKHSLVVHLSSQHVNLLPVL